MNQTSNPNVDALEKATGELARLNGQIEAARAMLDRLSREVAAAESHLDNSQAALVLAANEKLVVSALRAQTDAARTARALNEVSRAAELDAMTKLPNRALLLDRFAHAIAIAKRHRARLALLFMDLDGFKQINDALGHAVGDAVLKLVAHRLVSSVRASDTVSRHGGDEFVILLAEVSHASDAALIATKVLAALSAPGRVDEHVFRLTASIGISIYPDDGDDAATLIAQADAAMYRAKREGPGSFIFHHAEPPSEQSLAPPPLKALQQTFTHYEFALAEQERRYAQLQEANEQLLLTALRAQELLAAADQAQRRGLQPSRPS